jgi:hypothetical protein
MTPQALKLLLKLKKAELEMAMEQGRPQAELIQIYKQLKELQFQILQKELEGELS